jgi:alpha-glucosidase
MSSPNNDNLKTAGNSAWWRGGAIYHIYPRSFMDSNGDGIGDLNGVRERLHYIAELGVDAVWLSPFFTSPMKDFGYDVSDYCGVDPMFGTLSDFCALMDTARSLNLKVMIDLVLSHTSDQHPWFVQSRTSHDNPKSDWYVWADGKLDGGPPNNWLSIFGGSAWQWSTKRRQYFLHNFLASQPDLNFHSPAVQDAVLDVARFWLDLGVHGFRLDTVNFYFHDQQLRDNPGRGMPDGSDPAVSAVNPYAWQRHLYDKSRPEMLPFLSRLRALTDSYPDTAMVGEIGDDDGLMRATEYTAGNDRLHMAYSFDLLGARHDAPYLYGVLQRFAPHMAHSWICWSLSNHDVPRIASRWGGTPEDDSASRLGLMLALALRGTPCLYQGDELALPEVELAYEHIRDPYGIEMWPDFKGRDGCRTPMPWDDQEPHLGFSNAERTWLPFAETHTELAVTRQLARPDSVLHCARRLLAARKQRSSLITGDMTLLDPHEQVLAFERSAAHGERTWCVLNTSDRPASYALPSPGSVVADSGRGEVRLDGNTVHLSPRTGAWITA